MCAVPKEEPLPLEPTGRYPLCYSPGLRNTLSSGTVGRGGTRRHEGESMPEYRHSVAAIRALVRDDAVHRDVYINPELFDLEMERLWRSAWTYVGHDSQVPNTGDFYTVNIARHPL